MAKLAQDVMTPDPACCTPETPLEQIAKMMAQSDCGEIPVIDPAEHPIGVVTDRDIVCRVVAEGKNPMAYTAEICMSQPVVTVRADAPLDHVIATMEQHPRFQEHLRLLDRFTGRRRARRRPEGTRRAGTRSLAQRLRSRLGGWSAGDVCPPDLRRDSWPQHVNTSDS